MQVQSEIIYPESIMAHSYFVRILSSLDKNKAKGRLCVCSGVCYICPGLPLTSPNFLLSSNLSACRECRIVDMSRISKNSHELEKLKRKLCKGASTLRCVAECNTLHLCRMAKVARHMLPI